MTVGVMHQLELLEDQEAVQDALQAAFLLTYGAENARSLFNATVREIATDDGEVLSAAGKAELDVADVYARKPHSAVLGFWLFNNGLNDRID